MVGKKLSAVSLLGGAVTLLLAACGSSSASGGGSGADKSYTVTIDQPVFTVAGAPIYIALAKGFFKAHGVEIKFSTLNTAATVEEALKAGSIQFATGGAFNIVEADQKGAGYQVVENFGAPTLQLCVAKTFAQQQSISAATPLKEMLTKLKGAAFGVNGFGSPVTIPLYYLLKADAGVDPTTWVKTVNLGSVSAAQTAFERGQISVLVNSPPVCQQTSGKGEVLLTTGFLPEFKSIPYQAFYGEKTWMSQHAAATGAVAQAMAEGNKYVVQHAASAAAILHEKYFPTVSTASILSLINTYYAHTIPVDGRASAEGWQQVNKIMLESGAVTAAPSSNEGVMWTNKYLSS
jgi:NitT/TauT family transport system substrate-binding protein